MSPNFTLWIHSGISDTDSYSPITRTKAVPPLSHMKDAGCLRSQDADSCLLFQSGKIILRAWERIGNNEFKFQQSGAG